MVVLHPRKRASARAIRWARSFSVGHLGTSDPRQPLVVVSPWARQNFVDHTVTDQTSILRFVEDNWLGGTRIGQGSFDGFANPSSRCSILRGTATTESCS